MESTLFNYPQEEKVMHQSYGWFSRLVRRVLGGSRIICERETKNDLQMKVVLRIFAASVKKFPWTTAGVLIMSMLGSMVTVIVPTYYKEFFNITAAQLSVPIIGELLIAAVTTIFALNMLHVLTERTGHFLLIRLAKNVMVDLRLRAFNHLIMHSHGFFSGSFTGSLVQKLARIARSYDRIADSIVFHILPAIVTVTGVVFVLWGESRILALAVLAWVGVLLLMSYLFARWKLPYDVVRSELDSKVTATTADIFSNQPAVEAHGSHEYEKMRHEKVVQENFTTAAFTWRLGSVFGATQHVAIIGLEFLTFFIGVGLWMKGEFPLSMFMLVYVYVFRITGQLWPFSQVIRDIYESFAEAKEPAEFMTLPHEIVEQAHPVNLHDVKGQIDFCNVTFSYKGKIALRNITLSIKRGERVALVGRSGAGKSTLTKLLLRLYDVDSGSVEIDGVDVRSATLQSLKQAMSIVPQDPALFHRSLRENIRYGRQSASDEDVVAAAKLAYCHEFILSLSDGYDTLVGERGIKLSGGERQRVAIARAFLRDAPILVLDEATSSLDSLSESLVQDALNRIMHNRTTLVIAHRLSTIRNIERILVLDDGEIIEDGTHETLLARDGLYAQLWSSQQSGFALHGKTQTAHQVHNP